MHACYRAISVTLPMDFDSVCYWINIWRKLNRSLGAVKHYSTYIVVIEVVKHESKVLSHAVG
jgi:XRE family aerobic/anaerobic benzoate catabolism transcriptional regulator